MQTGRTAVTFRADAVLQADRVMSNSCKKIQFITACSRNGYQGNLEEKGNVDSERAYHKIVIHPTGPGLDLQIIESDWSLERGI